MNIESWTDRVKGIRTHVIHGEIKLSDIKTFLGTLYNSAEYDPEFHAVWDVREADFPEVTPSEIRDLAYFVRANWTGKYRRKAAVVVFGDFHFGLSRMFAQFVSPSAHGKIKVFRDLRGAADWIDGRIAATTHPIDGRTMPPVRV